MHEYKYITAETNTPLLDGLAILTKRFPGMVVSIDISSAATDEGKRGNTMLDMRVDGDGAPDHSVMAAIPSSLIVRRNGSLNEAIDKLLSRYLRDSDAMRMVDSLIERLAKAARSINDREADNDATH